MLEQKGTLKSHFSESLAVRACWDRSIFAKQVWGAHVDRIMGVIELWGHDTYATNLSREFDILPNPSYALSGFSACASA